MRCPQCGHENRGEARFCEECSAMLFACSSCGRANRPSAKFCDECGASLSADSAGSPREAAASFGYTPRFITERILTRRSAREGERKLVTVLFADVADSSGLAQQLDPEILHGVLDGVLRLIAELVHRNDGTVSHYLGDGLMALFGAPVALEDHAFRAVHAALEMQEVIGKRAEELERDQGIRLRLRIGLDTGQVVVGLIGDRMRMDYTAMGNTAHVAARMEALAEPGTVLVTEATWHAAAGDIEAERVGPMMVKGQHQPIVVYRVTGRKRQRDRLGRRGRDRLTGLVGRRRELALLRERAAAAAAGRGQAVAIAGEAGLGKSRLVHEFRQAIAADGIEWIESGCAANGQGVPYAPILEILRALFGIDDGDGAPAIAAKLGSRLTALGVSGERLPLLEFLFAVPGAEEALRGLDARARRERTWEAIVEVFAAASHRRPMVVAVEDLHWSDQSSEDFLACLAERLAALPILLLTTHRPGNRLRWTGLPVFTQIDLDPLAAGEMQDMLGGLFGDAEISPPLLRYIAEKSGGNPLFVEEISQVLVEQDYIMRAPAQLQLAGAAEVELPPTIQGLIQARVDGLGEAVKETVQIAAVIGAEFDLRLLAAVSEMPREVPLHVETLRRLELINESKEPPHDEFRFKHAVIRDVIYASLLAPRRHTLHGAVGRTMETLGREDQAAVLAYHFAHSDERQRAIPYALAAGDQAARMFATEQARGFYGQARALARGLSPTLHAQRSEIDAAIKLAGVSSSRDAHEEDRQNLERALSLAEALGDEPRTAGVLYWLGRLAYVRGHFRGAIEFSERSLSIAERCNDEALTAPPVNLMGRSCYLTGEYRRAAQLLARSVEQMHAIRNIVEESTAAGFAGVAFAALGEFGRALAYADRGIRLAEQLRNPFAEAAAYNYRAVAYCQQGTTAAAIADCERTREIAERSGDRFRIYLAQFYEGQAYTMAGKPARARELLENSIALALQLGTTTLLAWGKALLATALLALSDAEGVVALCREAIALAEESADRAAKALAQRALAVALAGDPAAHAEAERTITEAMESQREFGFEPEFARSQLSYAELLSAWGRGAEAERLRREATAVFARLGMVEELARTEAAVAVSAA